jgi:hypothetical protein
MPDSNDNTNWRDGLTAEQVSMVEKATAASFDRMALAFDTVGGWEKLSPYQKDKNAVCILDGLRAAGIIPPAKVKTRGEVVASRMVPEPVQGSNEVFILHAANERPPLLLFQGQGFSGSADLVRKYIAEAVDAECDRAIRSERERCIRVITEVHRRNNWADYCLRLEVKALDGESREHLRDDVTQPHEPAAPSL